MAGTLALSATTVGIQPYPHAFYVRIDTSGNLGAGAYSLSTDGEPFVGMGVVPASGVIDVAGGNRITFVPVGSPAFVAGTTYTGATGPIGFSEPSNAVVAPTAVVDPVRYKIMGTAPSTAVMRIAQLRGEIESRILGSLSFAGQPVTQWSAPENGGVERSIVRMAATAMADIIAPRLVRIAEMRMLDTSSGGDLTYYALKRYKIARNEATHTIQNIKISSVLQNDFAAGDLVVKGAGGNVYRSIDAVKIPTGAGLSPGVPAVSVRFQAEFPGSSYNDQAGTITTMVTSPAGVTCVNAEPDYFAPTSLLGVSTGTITGVWELGPDIIQQHGGGFSDTIPGLPVRPAFGSIRIKIRNSGEIGTGTFDWSIDGGATWPGFGIIIPSAAYEIPDGTGYGAKIYFTNGAGNPSFVTRDIFTLLVADAILQRGADAESDVALRARCRSRWSSLSDVPTEGLVNLWCHQASPEVDRVRVDADTDTPGTIRIMVASTTGPASPAAVIAVQDFVSVRLRGFQEVPPTSIAGSPEERAIVSSARPREIGATGTVSVARSKLAAVQTEADRLWSLYLGGVEIGGTVRKAELYQQIMDAGATDAVGILIFTLANGVTTTAEDLYLASDEVAVPGGRVGDDLNFLNGTAATLTASLIWKPI